MVNKIKINKKILLATVGVILIAAGGALAFYVSGRNNDQNQVESANNSVGQQSDQKLSSEEQKAEVDKKATQSQNQTEQNSPSNVKAVTPIITSQGQSQANVEVAARIPGIVEDGGICTLKMTKGSSTVTGSRKGVSNVSEVSCGYIAIPRSKLSAGNWTATVSYSSAKAKGTSAPEVVSVQ